MADSCSKSTPDESTEKMRERASATTLCLPETCWRVVVNSEMNERCHVCHGDCSVACLPWRPLGGAVNGVREQLVIGESREGTTFDKVPKVFDGAKHCQEFPVKCSIRSSSTGRIQDFQDGCSCVVLTFCQLNWGKRRTPNCGKIQTPNCGKIQTPQYLHHHQTVIQPCMWFLYDGTG